MSRSSDAPSTDRVFCFHWFWAMASLGRMTRYEAYIDKQWEDRGLANLVIARFKADATCDFAHLIVDVYCLGVKDVVVETGWSELEFRDYLAEAVPGDRIEPILPACARKLVDGAAGYASALGFAPHRDLSKARRIFSGVDASACPRDFTYGKDGRPYFIAGPNDSAERINRVLTILEARFGSDGFGFTVPGDETEPVESVRYDLMDWLEDEPEDVPRFHEFSGIVTGLLLCPTPTSPLKVMDVLWGPGGRTWNDQAELQMFTGWLMQYWNEISDVILDCVGPSAPANAWCVDVWAEDFDEDGGVGYLLAMRNWCAGLVRAVESWPPAEAARLQRPDLAPHWELVTLLAQIETEGHAARISAMTEEDPPRRLGSSVTALARALRPPVD